MICMMTTATSLPLRCVACFPTDQKNEKNTLVVVTGITFSTTCYVIQSRMSSIGNNFIDTCLHLPLMSWLTDNLINFREERKHIFVSSMCVSLTLTVYLSSTKGSSLSSSSLFCISFAADPVSSSPVYIHTKKSSFLVYMCHFLLCVTMCNRLSLSISLWLRNDNEVSTVTRGQQGNQRP